MEMTPTLYSRPVNAPRGFVYRSRSQHRTDRRSAAASVLSFLFPGLGQAYNGDRLLASVLAVPVVLALALAALAVITGGRDVLTRFLDMQVLLALVVFDVALLGWRLLAILQAHAARSRLSARGWPTWVTGVLVVVTLATHGTVGYYVTKVIDTLGALSTEGGGVVLEGSAGGGIELPEPSVQPARHERVTVLLVGIDSLPGRDHALTDTMVVASLDPGSGSGAMISVPRDLYGVPLGDGRTYDAKLNSLLVVAAADPETYPLGGPRSLKDAIGELLGTTIHYIAAVDIEGMKDVIDAVGGIDVTVEHTIVDPASDAMPGGFRLEPGSHHLDGELALAYVRSRSGAGETDFTRAERQQQVLAAIGKKLSAGNLILTLPALLDAVKDSVATDIPSDRLTDLAAAAQDTDISRLERVVLVPPEFVTPEPFSAHGYILHPNLEEIRALVARVLAAGAASH